MFGSLAKGIAALSLMLKQPLSSFCDFDTVDGDTLVGRRGERVTFIKVKGLRRMTMRSDVEAIAEGLRMELSGSLEAPGHAIQAWYACDPALSGSEIERQLQGSRRIARELRMHLVDIFAERERLWPRIMRWEVCYFVLWSKPSLLNREETQAGGRGNQEADCRCPGHRRRHEPVQGERGPVGTAPRLRAEGDDRLQKPWHLGDAARASRSPRSCARGHVSRDVEQ